MTILSKHRAKKAHRRQLRELFSAMKIFNPVVVHDPEVAKQFKRACGGLESLLDSAVNDGDSYTKEMQEHFMAMVAQYAEIFKKLLDIQSGKRTRGEQLLARVHRAFASVCERGRGVNLVSENSLQIL